MAGAEYAVTADSSFKWSRELYWWKLKTDESLLLALSNFKVKAQL